MSAVACAVLKYIEQAVAVPKTTAVLWVTSLVCGLLAFDNSTPVTITTTSGHFQGIEEYGVTSFKGIRFGQPATGALRWAPPVPHFSSDLYNATAFGPACVQQWAASRAIDVRGSPESEDCLFLNIWAPSSFTEANKPVVVWIYGGGLAFGTASLPTYDGKTFAANQSVVIVTFNYRTNIFGFPSSPDIPAEGNNLGFLDQELAFKWVQDNIKQFGGDPNKVTIMGESAGAQSVSTAIARHSQNPPFRAGIMLSGAFVSTSPHPSYTSFDAFATAAGCMQAPGPARLACLKAIPTDVIKKYINGPTSGGFRPVVDNFTVFADPLERIRSKQAAGVPILIGSMQDDGATFAVGETDLSSFLNRTLGRVGVPVPADIVRSLYPGLNDTQVIAAAVREFLFLCPAELWTRAVVQSGISSVFRYTYGATFPDLEIFPGAGAWHASELRELFGTYNTSTATPAEITLSHSFQTAFANFIKDPNVPPAPQWHKYVPGNETQTLAKLAYDGNVDMDDFVEAVQSDVFDGPCHALWNKFLDYRP